MKKNEMEVSSENEENFSPEKQKRIDEEMKKSQQIQRTHQIVSIKIYGIHNKKDEYITWVVHRRTKKENYRKMSLLLKYFRFIHYSWNNT